MEHVSKAQATLAQGFGSFVEGAKAFAKGLYDPDASLKATLTQIKDVNVPQAYHTVAVVKGRAYMFGGKTTSKNGGHEIADNDLHVVILPSSGIDSADYKRIAATDEAPPRRYGHAAAVIDDTIYISGGVGVDGGKPLDENGRIWAFDTTSGKWSHLDPAAKDNVPAPRSQHAAVASTHPQPAHKRTDENIAPQQPIDPSSIVPEPLAPNSYGTLIIQGGQGQSGTPLHDLWAFNVASRIWTELPAAPPPVTDAPSLTLLDNRLYAFSQGQTNYLDLHQPKASDATAAGLSPLGPWSSLPPQSSAPDKPHPGDRTAAHLSPITLGQGRNHLLLVGGVAPSGRPLGDVWSLPLRSEELTSASVADAAWSAVAGGAEEQRWLPVRCYDADGKLAGSIGARKGAAVARGAEIDGASVLVWGGEDSEGKIRGDGLLVTVNW